jgi:hypothetical protein
MLYAKIDNEAPRFLAKADAAGMGAQVPVILTSCASTSGATASTEQLGSDPDFCLPAAPD